MRGKNLVTWLDWRRRRTWPRLELASVFGIWVEKRLPLNTYAAYFVPRPRLASPLLCFYTRKFLLILQSSFAACEIYTLSAESCLRWLLPCALFVRLWSLNNQQQQQQQQEQGEQINTHKKNLKKKQKPEDGESHEAYVVQILMLTLDIEATS